MTNTLTEQWREGNLPVGHYYCKLYYNGFKPRIQECVKSAYSPKSCIPMSCGCEGEEVLAPVPSYGSLYNPNDGRIPVGLFTVLKLIKRDIERWQKTRPLTDLECGIKSQVVSLLKRWGWGLESKTDESSRKALQLEKKLAIATIALKEYANCKPTEWMSCVTADKALKEMEGVK